MRFLVNRYLTGLFLILLTAGKIHAQDERVLKALALETTWSYADALKYYLKVEEEGKGDFESKLNIAELYYKQRDFTAALIWFEKALKINQINSSSMLHYAYCLRSSGQWKSADSIGKVYSLFTPVASLLERMDSAIWDVNNIRNLNSELDEMSAVFYRDGIVYVTDNTSDKKNVYAWNNRPWLTLMHVTGKNFQNNLKPSPFPITANSKYHVGPAVFCKNDNQIFVSQNRPVSKKGGDIVRVGLYQANKSGNSWSTLQPFKFNSDNYSIAQAAISADGKEMYFVSDMPGGFGGTDIYHTTFKNNTWTVPVNLGAVINTSSNEMFPFLKDSILYFSSEGHIGFGGLDIFFSVKNENGDWLKPVNIGLPVNSGFDDFSWNISKDGNQALFTSNRPGGKGADDIYMATLNSVKQAQRNIVCKFNVSGIVRDKNTGAVLENAQIIIQGKEIVKSGVDGKYVLEFPCNDFDGYIRANVSGYFPGAVKIHLDNANPFIEANFELIKVEVNKPIAVSNIYYDLDKSDIKADAAEEMDVLAQLLQQNPSWIIEIGSHTDSRAEKDYNLKLSDARARAAVDYLVSKGINRDRLFAKGYGESKLVNQCKDGVNCSEEQHALNRRTEFKLIGFDKFSYTEGEQTVQTDKVLFDPTYTKTNTKVVYKIQLGVFVNPDVATLQKFSDLGNVTHIKVSGSSASKYYLESYATYATAQGYLQQVKNRGFKDAFIVAYYKGKVIGIDQAKKLE